MIFLSFSFDEIFGHHNIAGVLTGCIIYTIYSWHYLYYILLALSLLYTPGIIFTIYTPGIIFTIYSWHYLYYIYSWHYLYYILLALSFLYYILLALSLLYTPGIIYTIYTPGFACFCSSCCCSEIIDWDLLRASGPLNNQILHRKKIICKIFLY